MNIRRLINILIAIAALTMTTACYNYDREVEDKVSVGDCYINLAISVSNGNHSTRAVPAGGEDGDGREAGFERENNVTGITLILYRTVDPTDGINVNTGSEDPVLELVRYFPVTLGNRDPQGSPYTTKTEEAYYITGDQPLGKPKLNLSGTYHAIVIANASEVAASLTEGTSRLSDIRDVVLNTIYVGDPTKSADACINFIMSSEEDNTISFASATKTIDAEGDKHFDFSSQPIVIERMAARIDFWSKNSTGYDATTYSQKGYVYNVTGSSTDKFVVTGIVPFNLVNGHETYGSEYLLKRLRTDIADATTTTYLLNESTTTYVIDPKTDDKTTLVTPSLNSSLGNIYTLIDANKIEDTTENPYYHSVEAMHASSSKSTIDSRENVVVAYPMENCLLPESKLYYHATGIAIVGYYYQGGTGAGTRYVYLGYLRHQGDNDSYDILPHTTPLTTDEAMGTTTAMRFGVVRNNIYRVSIEGISRLAGRLSLKVAVHDWRHVKHPTINI